MRLPLLASLPAIAALLALGGCGLFGDCGPFPGPARFAASVHVDGAPAPDTLTVLFVDGGGAYGYEIMRQARPLVPVVTSDGALRLSVETLDSTGPRTVPQFETAVRGDTVFVRRALVRGACSVPEGVEHRVVRIEAPAGVRAVRVRTVGHEEVPFPASTASGRPASALLTV